MTLAGAEFAADTSGNGALPGNYGTDYIYPVQSEVDYFQSKKMNVVRLPFRWERLQPALNIAFDNTELGRLDTFVTATTAKGVSVILDPHNYARWHTSVVGSASLPNSAFADLWTRLATRYKGNARVIFALMNEPHDMSSETWLAAANAAISAIRATGANNLILVPGNGWTGAASWGLDWYGTPNASVMLGVVDPGNNYAYEVHQYLDGDGSGASGTCVSTTIGAERLAGFTSWLKTNNKRAFLGEFAGGNNATCQAAVTGALAHMQTNKDVWIGWTWWAAGPWWGSYIFTLEPANNVDAPQMNWLTPYLP
ncbi:MAG TPA: glycoside hydrolase family 5 protein [Rhodocyclaceae bacterium]|nr:glycoside hydrolase family 5 protein [Rhodocyclaceae bacterium]